MPADSVGAPRRVEPEAVRAWAERSTNASFALEGHQPSALSAIEMQAADMRYRYRMSPATLVTATIPARVAARYGGDAEIQAAANRLRIIVVVSEDGITPLRTFYPEGYEPDEAALEA